MTLTKADMAELLFDQVGLNKREAKDMVDACPANLGTMKKEAAADAKTKLEAAGAQVELK